MATEYKLSYTAQEIDKKLKDGASIKMTTTEEYEKLDKIDENTLYMFTDIDEVEVTPPDFAQNDPSAPDYIKNRTHWAEAPVTTTTEILPESTYEGFVDGYVEFGALSILDFKPDTEYTVTWDGVEYTVMTKSYLNFTICGNPAILGIEENAEDNGQPFGFVYEGTQYISIFISNDLEAASHTVGITRTVTTQEIHKLDDKYINAEWFPQKTTASTVGVVETTMTVTDTGEDMLPSESYDVNALKSAEYYDVLWNGTTYKCVPQQYMGIPFIGNISILDDTMADSGEPFVFGYGDVFGGVAPMVPAETEATFSITCYNSAIVSTIPEEYLPEKLQFGNEYEVEIQKEAITWDGDTTGRVTLEALNSSLKDYYHVSYNAPLIEKASNGGILIITDINDLSNQIITFNANAIIDNNGFFYSIGEPVVIIGDVVANLFGLTAGIYFLNNGTEYVSSFTINNYTFVEKETRIKTIDPKYLPEGIGGGGGASSEDIETLKTYVDSAIETAIGAAIAASY